MMNNIVVNSLLSKAASAFMVIGVFICVAPVSANLEESSVDGMERWRTMAHMQEVESVHKVLSAFHMGISNVSKAQLAETIVVHSRDYDMDPFIILALIKTESTFNNWSRSNKGAIGMMQILPATGKEVAEDLGLKWQGEKTLFDPAKNVMIGIHYLSVLRGRFSDDLGIAIAAYNRGPSDLARRLRRGSVTKFKYVDRVYSYYDDLVEDMAHQEPTG